MKKLFSVLLVLALCGIAIAATVNFYITNSAGSNTIAMAPGDINLYVWYAGDNLSSFDVYANCDIETDFDFIRGQITAINRDASYDYVGLDSQTSIEVAGVALDLTTNPPVGQTLGQGVATPLAKILYRYSMEAVTIDLAFVAAGATDWRALNTDDDTITMHGMILVPEPATIALLCLGGLALRRKR